MPTHPLNPESLEANETRREALGRFLRKRREALVPECVGISSSRGRRTPGLRREEVAFLADIGAKWYARLEGGDDIRPSEATLTAVAIALRLSSAELEYMLDLAGLRRPLPSADVEMDGAMPMPIVAFLNSSRGFAATVGDKILTPLRWNALADAIHGYSRFAEPVERNTLVRALFDPGYIEFLGSEHEELVSRAVGMFRLNGSSQVPSPFTTGVYERVKDDPLFQRAWNSRTVAGELANERSMVRNQARVGRLILYAIDFSTPMRPDLLCRTLVPADEETAMKFRRLEMNEQERPAFNRIERRSA